MHSSGIPLSQPDVTDVLFSWPPVMASLCPASRVHSHLDPGMGHVTCFYQRESNRLVQSRRFEKSACTFPPLPHVDCTTAMTQLPEGVSCTWRKESATTGPDGQQLSCWLTTDTPTSPVSSAMCSPGQRDLPGNLRLLRNNKWLSVMQQKLTDTAGIR